MKKGAVGDNILYLHPFQGAKQQRIRRTCGKFRHPFFRVQKFFNLWPRFLPDLRFVNTRYRVKPIQ